MTVATQAPAELTLDAVGGEPHTLREWVTTFHLLLVVIDPYTDESSWILDTASRVLANFRGADCRVGWLVTADADDARAFLGPLADEFLTLLDADRSVVKGLGLERLPALVHIRQDLAIMGAAEGWRPEEWRPVAHELAKVMSWSHPSIPESGDPSPFEGSPAQG